MDLSDKVCSKCGMALRAGHFLTRRGNKLVCTPCLVGLAWMGLAVKTDGAAVASGAITESLILANAAAEGINYQKGWIIGTTATVKVFIDIFIGVWAFILAYIWTRHINVKPGETATVKVFIDIFIGVWAFILAYICIPKRWPSSRPALATSRPAATTCSPCVGPPDSTARGATTASAGLSGRCSCNARPATTRCRSPPERSSRTRTSR